MSTKPSATSANTQPLERPDRTYWARLCQFTHRTIAAVSRLWPMSCPAVCRPLQSTGPAHRTPAPGLAKLSSMELPDVATSLLGEDGRGRSALLDVVDRWEDAQQLDAAPLIVRERLRDALHLSTVPDVERIDAGHSNPTFLVTSGDSRWVLRRPPRPPFARTAHDVLREHRILTALRDEPVRTPLPVVAVEDPAFMGAPFYAMEALDGVVLRDEAVAPLDSPAERER